jgi:hypothetical protein
LPISLVDAEGSELTVRADPVSLTVHSVLIEGDTELRDIKPQAALPVLPSWQRTASWALITLLGAVALWGLYRWLRSRRRFGARALRPAYQIALDELAQIETLDLPRQHRFKEHYTLVSHVLRRYLVDAHRVPALDQTTAEIGRALQSTALPPSEQHRLLNLLHQADMVKFANLTPEHTVATQSVPQARRFVLSTQPLSAGPGTVRSAPRAGEGAPA